MDATPAATTAARRTRATLVLFVISVIWGATFLWMKQAMGAVERVLGPDGATTGCALFLAVRFSAAALLVAVLFPSARRGLSPAAWKGGVWLGALLVAGFAPQMIGLAEVTPAVSAFLTSLYVVFLALVTAAVERRAPRAFLALGALLATAGAGLVRGRPEIAAWRAGELLTVVSAVAFAVHILATDRVTRRSAPLPVTLAMFATVAVGGVALLGAAAAHGPAFSAAQLIELARQSDFLVPLALTTALATVLALTLMNVFQRELDPVRAAILYALEPIWAAVFAIAAGADAFTGWLVVGGALLVAGNLFAEIAGLRRA